MKPRRARLLFGIAALLAAVLVVPFGRPLWWKSNPEAGFRTVAGRRLPPGVRASAYASEMNDNFFRTTHYWLLEGSPDAFRNVNGGNVVTGSDLLNARAAVPDMEALFGSSLTGADVVYAAYAEDRGRTRWLCVFRGETTALYVH